MYEVHVISRETVSWLSSKKGVCIFAEQICTVDRCAPVLSDLDASALAAFVAGNWVMLSKEEIAAATSMLSSEPILAAKALFRALTSLAILVSDGVRVHRFVVWCKG